MANDRNFPVQPWKTSFDWSILPLRTVRLSHLFLNLFGGVRLPRQPGLEGPMPKKEGERPAISFHSHPFSHHGICWFIKAKRLRNQAESSSNDQRPLAESITVSRVKETAWEFTPCPGWQACWTPHVFCGKPKGLGPQVRQARDRTDLTKTYVAYYQLSHSGCQKQIKSSLVKDNTI